jgi:uncharacterized damage-inducible protein DinB
MPDMADVRTPFPNADERTTLLAFLAYLREAIIRKTEGLDEQSLRHSPVPTGTSLLGLVKHLTFVESAWFEWTFGATTEELPSGDLEPDDTADSVIAAYRAAVSRSQAITDGVADLDQRSARVGVAPEEPMSLRWILVHMIEETGRHAGHADILRELLDGQTGR